MSAARALVSSTLIGWGLTALDAEARLLVSELVTNAVIHAGTEVDVNLTLLTESVEVGVADRHPSRTVPAPPAAVSEHSESSRGMLLVAAIASAWGIDYTRRTKRVWFRLAHADGSAPAAGPVGPVDADDGRQGDPGEPRELLDDGMPGRGGRGAGARSVAATADLDGPFSTSPELLVRLELGEVLERTVAWARDSFGGDGAYALLVADDDGDLEVRAVAGLRPDVERVPRPAAGASGRHDRALLPVVDQDLARSSAPSDAWLRTAGMRSLVAVPVLAEGRLIGSVGVGSGTPGTFSVADGARLQRAVDSVALAVQSARVAEIERRRHGWLGYLAEASELLAGTLEPEMALALVAQLVAPQLGPWCAVHLLDESGRSVPATVWHSDEDHIEDLRALFEAVEPPEPPTGRGVTRWQPTGPDLLPPGVQELARAGGHVVALVARGRAIGTLTVGHRGTGGQRGPRQQLHLLGDLAPRAAMTLDNARLYAERSATSDALQRSLLPPGLPDLLGVEVGVVYEAMGAGNEVGGDFYDIFRTPGPVAEVGERFAFAVGDVCGKGPEAAAVTGLARHALRLLSRRGDGIESVLASLNGAILDEGSRARFITVIYGEGEHHADGTLHLRFASAGHPAPVVVRRDGSTAAVGEQGDLLGVFEDTVTRITTLTLAPGESLVCFTDGVTERRAGDDMLGEDGVLAAVSGAHELSAPALARRLGAVVSEFTREPTRDDLAILVLRSRPRAG